MAQAVTWDEHPDLVLLANGERRGICCLVVGHADAEQTRALCLPGVFCVYRQGDQTALLYAQDAGFNGVPALEAAVSVCAFGFRKGLHAQGGARASNGQRHCPGTRDLSHG